MKSNHHTNAKAIIAFLILAIAFVIFYKFITYQNFYSQDPSALRNYVVFAIVGGGFLVGLLYLTNNSPEKVASKSKVVKSSKTIKAKKKKK